jgi:hypothetical protein
VGLSIKEGNDVEGRRTRRETDRLCSDKVAGGKGWHSREIKLKESKHEESHLALGVEGHLALG